MESWYRAGENVARAAAAGPVFEWIAFLNGPEIALRSDSDWKRFEELAVRLYPPGPTENVIWSRAEIS